MSNMFEKLTQKEEIQKSKKAAARSQKLRDEHKTTEIETIKSEEIAPKVIEKIIVKENRITIKPRTKGSSKTFYFTQKEIAKFKRWSEKGYVISEILRKLVNNAPEEF